jgi:hypothetical protein
VKRKPPDFRDSIPDVRDGLTRVERIILTKLQEAQRELKGRSVPSAMLYGRVAEHVNITPEELQEILARVGARRDHPTE